MRDAGKLVRHHWFYIVLPILFAAALAFHTTYPWQTEPRFGEAVALFDWCLFVPLLYAICYRTMPRRALAVRILAVISSGMWIAAKIVPHPAQTILMHFGWLRSAGIVMLAAFEGVAMIAALRVVFGTAPDPQALHRIGIPPLLAKLMLAEARFWRWLWTRLREL